MEETEEKKKGPAKRRGREVQVEFSFRIRDEKGLIMEFEDKALVPGSFVAPRGNMSMGQWFAAHCEAALDKFKYEIRVEAKRRAEEFRKHHENGTWPADGRESAPWHLPSYKWTQEQFDRADEEGRLSDLSLRPEDIFAFTQRRNASKS